MSYTHVSDISIAPAKRGSVYRLHKNGFSHVAESLQYLLVRGGEARLLVKRPHSGPRAELAVMG